MFLPPVVLGPYYGGTGPSGIGTGVLPGAKPLKAPGKMKYPSTIAADYSEVYMHKDIQLLELIGQHVYLTAISSI